ncbi:hypothetical protein Scep_005881 [Stephania cephalantha]|uniref:Uncharacterized protein n=1 Tax=Stephania cephalantha TaxID=152367 RepID=A0AAP0PWU3_9MAGN
MARQGDHQILFFQFITGIKQHQISSSKSTKQSITTDLPNETRTNETESLKRRE